MRLRGHKRGSIRASERRKVYIRCETKQKLAIAASLIEFER